MKPLLELIEEYGEACYEHGRLGVTYAGEDAYDKSGEMLTEMRARLEVMERDAARYRWLRDRDWFDGPLCVVRDPKAVFSRGVHLGADCPSRFRLDEAIDAAMAEGEAHVPE